MVGLFFTLRTHAAIIWQTVPAQIQPPVHNPGAAHRNLLRNQDGTILPDFDPQGQSSIRESQLYKRILGQSLSNIGLHQEPSKTQGSPTLHMVPPRSNSFDMMTGQPGVGFPGLTEENAHLIRDVAEVAAAAATAAVQDAQRHPGRRHSKPSLPTIPTTFEEEIPVGAEAADVSGGHDAPNWSRGKSVVVLLGATVLYAIVAEILVNTVDVVLENWDIDEKFLGFTLFALVPNTTEFLV